MEHHSVSACSLLRMLKSLVVLKRIGTTYLDTDPNVSKGYQRFMVFSIKAYKTWNITVYLHVPATGTDESHDVHMCTDTHNIGISERPAVVASPRGLGRGIADACHSQ